VSRKEKRISCITTISMAGDALMPVLVIHLKTTDAAVWEEGWRDGQDFMIRSNNMSYVARPFFIEHLTSVTFPNFAATREILHSRISPVFSLAIIAVPISMKVSSNSLQTITSDSLYFHRTLHMCLNISISSLSLPSNERNVRFVSGEWLDHKFGKSPS
jgi:hypothetical protein